MFDMNKGWLFPKLSLIVASLHWTIYFSFNQEIEGCGKVKKGVNYCLKLQELLGMDKRTEKV